MKEIILDGTIYSESIVKKAIKDYSTIAKIRFESKDNNIKCEFISSKYELEKTIKEFENYIIDLSNSSQDYYD